MQAAPGELTGRRAPSCAAFADALHLSSSAGCERAAVDEEAVDWPARLASDWHSTTGRLSSVAPWQAAGPQFQTMSRAMKRSLVGLASWPNRSRRAAGERSARPLKIQEPSEASQFLLFTVANCNGIKY